MHGCQVICSSLLNSRRFWVCCLITAMTFFYCLFSTVFCNRCTATRYKVAMKFCAKFYICTLVRKRQFVKYNHKSLMFIIYFNLCILHFLVTVYLHFSLVIDIHTILNSSGLYSHAILSVWSTSSGWLASSIVYWQQKATCKGLRFFATLACFIITLFDKTFHRHVALVYVE